MKNDARTFASLAAASILAGSLALVPGGDARAQSATIVSTKHNLSVSGPGEVKASSETRICIFCHTPHRAGTSGPLWNKAETQASYLPYQSSSMHILPGQPNGTSKLCLSCHDGTIALGLLISESAQLSMTYQFPRGRSLVGTDLSDDHPVSFTYDPSVSAANPEIADPTNNPDIHLDPQGRMQCTSCHDAHNDIHGHFLRESNQQSALCKRCHIKNYWENSSHATSSNTWDGTPPDPWPYTNEQTVAANACANCHTPHLAGEPERLLYDPLEEQNCLKCHNGHTASKDLEADFAKLSTHPVDNYQGIHEPGEDPYTMNKHVECLDCHDPHSANSLGNEQAPFNRSLTKGVSGVNAAGDLVEEAGYEYEICFKCHAGQHSTTPHVPRVINETNTRLEFDPNNPSFHPVEAPGKNQFVPSLISPYTTASIIYCTDCHSSDTGTNAGGQGANGPHGSAWEPLLERRYETSNGMRESSALYALCYKCHSRSSILGNQSFKEHKKHIEGEKASCATCHDPHGISSAQGNSTNNAHLINFNTLEVQPSNSGKLEFIDLGQRRGKCYLKCHNKNHDPKSY
jgi:predicted CXXCH cytochrome family protein